MTYLFYEKNNFENEAEYRLRCSGNTVNNHQIMEIDKTIKSFLGKNYGITKNSDLEISLKPGKAKLRGIPEYAAIMKLITDRGIFHAKTQGIGPKQAINNCTQAIQNQIMHSTFKKHNRVRSRGQDPYMASEFLEEA
ncbi:hypothetical protein K9L97_05455 [Candidatus Woesearchaeota archaeon]|nr:hypothetical protein [Candidatus Woesearchaeota archaeon]